MKDREPSASQSLVSAVLEPAVNLNGYESLASVAANDECQ